MPAKRAQTLGSCSSTAVLGSKWEDPSFPAAGSHLTALRVLCQAAPAPTAALGHCQCSAPPPCLPPWASWPACLGSEPAVWQEQLCCSAGSSSSLRQQQWPHADPTCARGSAQGHGGCQGSAGDAGAAGRERGHRAAGWAKPGRQRGAKPPGEALDQSLSQSVKLLAQSSLSPGWLCPLRCLLPLRAGLVPTSEPANQ